MSKSPSVTVSDWVSELERLGPIDRSPGLPLKHDFSQDKSVCFHAGRDLVGKHSSKDCLSDMSLQIYVTLNSKAFQGHEFQICSKHSINKISYRNSFDLTDMGTPPKKNVFFRALPEKGGGGRPLPELKNTIYIFIFDGRKRCTSCPKEGEGGYLLTQFN